MGVVTEIKLSVTRTVNLGNYESVKLEGHAIVGKDNDDDTGETLRAQALDEVYALIQEAYKEHVPKRRNRDLEKGKE